MNLLSILLMAPSADGSEQGGIMSFLPLILVIIVFYFFFIRPQMKKSKEQKQFRAELKKGDAILTIGGINGKIVKMGETTVDISTGDTTIIRVEKSAIVPKDTQLGQQK